MVVILNAVKDPATKSRQVDGAALNMTESRLKLDVSLTLRFAQGFGSG